MLGGLRYIFGVYLGSIPQTKATSRGGVLNSPNKGDEPRWVLNSPNKGGTTAGGFLIAFYRIRFGIQFLEAVVSRQPRLA